MKDTTDLPDGKFRFPLCATVRLAQIPPDLLPLPDGVDVGDYFIRVSVEAASGPDAFEKVLGIYGPHKTLAEANSALDVHRRAAEVFLRALAALYVPGATEDPMTGWYDADGTRVGELRVVEETAPEGATKH